MPAAPSTRYGLVGPSGGDAPDNPLAFSTVIANIEANLSQLIAARTIGEVGVLNQARAGRQLVPADVTDLGLSTPIGLWNMGDLTDASGNARALTNKGGVVFGKGITGAATEAAIFPGTSTSSLYRVDEAALSIRTGAFGCWFRTAKRGTTQMICSKRTAAGQLSWQFYITSTNVLECDLSFDGATQPCIAVGLSDVCDDKFHFAWFTFDGTALRIYVDGVLEATMPGHGAIFDGIAPFNIGSRYADGATAADATTVMYGRIDEALLLADVPTLDQIRKLMAVKISHTLPRPAKSVPRLNIRALRKGPQLTQAMFTSLGLTAPLRIYNMDDLLSDGSGAVALTANSAPVAVPGPAGIANNAFLYDGVDDYHQAADTNLPDLLTPSTMLIWFKSRIRNGVNHAGLIGYGAGVGASDRAIYIDMSGRLAANGGGNIALGDAYVADGEWHLAVAVFDNGAADGLKLKLYNDAALTGAVTAFASTNLGGANALKLGARVGAPAGGYFNGILSRGAIVPGVMTADQIASIYAQGTQDTGMSPYLPGEYVERVTDTGLFVVAGSEFESQEQVELEVTA